LFKIMAVPDVAFWEISTACSAGTLLVDYLHHGCRLG
jgi:hypothetical protein